MDNVRATNHIRPKLVFPALRLGRTGDAMHHFLALLRTGVFSDHTDAHAILGKTVCPQLNRPASVAVADVGQVLGSGVRRLISEGVIMACSSSGSLHFADRSAPHPARATVRLPTYRLPSPPVRNRGHPYPAKAHTIGILPIGTDEQIVIPGKPQRGSHRHTGNAIIKRLKPDNGITAART